MPVDYAKISKPTKQDCAYHLNSISGDCFLLMRDWSWKIKEISRSVLNGKGGLPVEVVYNLRMDFPENCSSI